jgi:hypothetical protein
MEISRFVAALKCALLVSLSSLVVYAQQTGTGSLRLLDSYRQAQFPTPSNAFPFRYWDKGFLITYTADDTRSDRPAAVLYDRNGAVAREATVSFKGAKSVGIDDVAISRSGKLVVAGGTESPDGAIANFIASIDAKGNISQVIRTTPFLPVYVCAAEGDTVWSYGVDKDSAGKPIENSPRLRQYSFDKGQLRAVLDATTLNPSGWTLTRGRYPGDISFRCNGRKIVLLNSRSDEWVELEIATNKLTVSKLTPLPQPKQVQITGFALTEAGDVFVSLHDTSSDPPRSGLFKLEFDGNGVGSWVPVKNTVGTYLHGSVDRLLGADGSDLIYTRDLDGTAHWSQITK